MLQYPLSLARFSPLEHILVHDVFDAGFDIQERG